MANCLERCIDKRVEVQTLERLMEPEEGEVCMSYILKHATRRGNSIFQIFDTKKERDHFVAIRRR